ncbi:MAG: energy-coupling factor ABC transporter ATP-binding protein [Burkholderiaceae bacterium]|jgi:cobalt/nickel transport system ATP-binding protein|nr:energy-coupling factor ABC transporter ATP-binding protein [Burkholderiaceae bacterium]
MIELDNLVFGWPDGPAIFNRLSLKIAAGEKVVLLGANGCGKSTLLKLMNGLLFPQGGRLLWHGEELRQTALRQRDLARRFRGECVLLFQHPEAMLFNPTVREEIAYTLKKLGRSGIEATVAHWAGELHIAHLLDKAPFNLSGGEKQKVALAALLALDPQLLLLDEPGASLDPATVGWLVDTLAPSGRTVIASTHDLSLAAELGLRCIVFGAQGRLLFDGPMGAALADLPLLEKAGLAHRHRHRHGGGAEHSHLHGHNW